MMWGSFIILHSAAAMIWQPPVQQPHKLTTKPITAYCNVSSEPLDASLIQVENPFARELLDYVVRAQCRGYF